MQVSICLQTIVDFMGKYENGYTDSLEDMDPIVKRLFLERGYEEKPRHRRNKSPAKNAAKRDSKDQENSKNFSVPKV